jgi:hypothetical protein
MSKKLFISLAPLLAITALAVVPASSGAAVRYYKNFPPTSEYTPGGGHFHVIAWGKLTLSPEPAVAAVTTCENMASGYIENPATLTANGIGATERFATWNCENKECPAGKVTIGGVEFEKEFEVVSPPQSFPWPSEEIEETPTLFRTRTEPVTVELACMAHKLTRAEAGEGKGTGKEGGENEQFVLPSGGAPTVTCVTVAGTHEQKPEDVNGSGSNPAKLVFGGGTGNAGAGSLSCAGGAFEGKTKESLKVMGYTNSGLVNSNN